MKIYPIEGRRVAGTVAFITVKEVPIHFGFRYYNPPPKNYIIYQILETIQHRICIEAYNDVLTNAITRNSRKFGYHRGKPLNILEWLSQ